MIKKSVFLGSLLLAMFSCQKEQKNIELKENSELLKEENDRLKHQIDSLQSVNRVVEIKNLKEELDTQKAGQVAVEFINYFANTEKIATDLATSNFLKIYRNNEIKIKKSQDEAAMYGDAWDIDPAKGEKYGIFLGNDYDNAYKFKKVLKTEGNSVYVLLEGSYYKNTVKMIFENDKWLVDGAGDLNIPKSLQRY